MKTCRYLHSIYILSLAVCITASAQQSFPARAYSSPVKMKPDGKGAVSISGELKQWHKVTLTLDGPFAAELENDPNPFTDYSLMVTFTHESGSPSYNVPGYLAAGGGASGFLNERKVLETNQVTSGLHGGPRLEGFKLPDPVLNHIYYWNAARLIPRVRQVLEARGFKIGYELGGFKCDRLPPDVTVNKLTVAIGQPADLTGTLGSVTESLVVEIAGKAYAGVDNMDGTWKLPGEKIAGLPVGTHDVKVTARNCIGLVRADSTKNELTVAESFGDSKPIK